MNTPNKFGSALITNSMLCQAARFVEDPSELASKQLGAFFDFCNLVESVVLHNHLYTLEGKIVGPCADLASFTLPSLLSREGILVEQSIPLDPYQVQRNLLKIVGTDRVFNRIVLPGGLSTWIAEMLPEAFPDEEMSRLGGGNFPEAYRLAFDNAISHEIVKRNLSSAPNVFYFFRNNNFLEFLHGTGGPERGAYVLRTYLYSHSAWNERISFVPDYPRIPFLASVIDSIHNSVITEAYEIFAEKLGSEAEDFLKDQRPIGLPIPPFTAILLGRCNSRHDIGYELLELRDEYAKLRQNLATLEEQRLESANIYERNKTRVHVEAIFNASAKKFDRNGFSRFKELVDFASDVAAPVYDPSNPGSYKTSLLTKPVEWIRDWWLKRPLAQFFDLAKEFRSINEYNRLVNKVFNIEFTDDDVKDFKASQLSFQQVFSEKE